MINTIDLHKFLSENKGKEGTLIQFRFKNNTLEIGVDSPEFFISEKFELEEAQNPGAIDSAIFVKCEDAEKVIPVLGKSKADKICLEKRDNKLFILPNCSIPIERDVPNRQRAAQNVVIIKDPSILHCFATISTTAGKNQSPPAPYIEGALFHDGFSCFAVNQMMVAEHKFPLSQLAEWESSITIPEGFGYERRFTIPATAIAKFDPSAPIEIHISGATTTLKSGRISLKIEKVKDPLSVYIANNALNNKSSFSISLDEPENSSEPSRIEKLINWLKQSKSTSCDLLVGPSGIWVGPRGALKKPDFASDEVTLAKSLHLDTKPCGNTNRIASFTVSVIKAIAKLGMKSVKISFPEKEGDVICIESLYPEKEYSLISTKAQFVEIPITEVVAIPEAELADSKPLVIEKGGETLMEVTPSVAEAIQTAIAEDKVPETIKETVEAAVETMSNETLSVIKGIAKGDKSAITKLKEQNAFTENGEEAANAVVSTQPAVADAQQAIAETAIVEAIDVDSNVIQLDPKTKKKAKTVKEAVQATKAELETELKSESVDLNRIIALTLRLDTVGGRFIEIVFSLQTNWIPVLNIDEKFKEDAAKTYPHLVAA